jgi:hypothetical protein
MADINSNPILAAAADGQAPLSIETPSVSTASPTDPKLLAIENAIADSSVNREALTTNIKTAASERSSLGDIVKNAISEATAANQTIRLAADVADMQAQNNTIAGFEAGGGTDEQVLLMAQMKDQRDELNAIMTDRRAVQKSARESGSLAAAIGSRFHMKQTQGDLDAAKDRLANTSAQIASLSGATESFSRVNQLTKRTINEGTIAANYKKIGAEGDVKAAQAEIININSNADSMAALVDSDSRNIQSLLSAYRIDGEAEGRELAREKMKLQREKMALQREINAIELPKAKVALEQAQTNLIKSKKLGPTQIAAAELAVQDANKRIADAAKVEVERATAVQQGQSLLGIPIETAETITARAANAVTREKYALLQDLGGVDDMVIGSTPSEARSNLSVFENTPDTRMTGILDTITSAQIEEYAASPDGVPKNSKVIEEDFNSKAKVFMDTASAKITTGDTSNPYHSVPMGVLANNMKAVRDDEFYKTTLEPMGMKDMNPEAILEAGVAGIRAGTVTPEQVAVGIETIFDSAAAYNNTAEGGYRRVGLPNQTTYNVQFKKPSTFSSQLKLLSTAAQAAPVALVNFTDEGDLGLVKSSLKALNDPFISVDLMDPTRVKELVVKMLSAEPVKTATPTSPVSAPAQTPNVIPDTVE